MSNSTTSSVAGIAKIKGMSQLRKKLDRQLKILEKNRDELRTIVSEAEDVLNDIEGAHDDLERIVDDLSHYV